MQNPVSSVFWASIIALNIYLPSGVAADTNESANTLFVQAVQGWQAAELMIGGDTASARLRVQKLHDVGTAIDTIIAEHSGSNLAVQLVIGESVGPLSVPIIELARRKAELRLQIAQCTDEPTKGCIIDYANNIVNQASSELPSFFTRDIAVSQAQAGFYDESLQTAEGIQNSPHREEALSELSISLAEAGLVEEALDLASALSIETSASKAFKSIVLARIESGDFQEAERLLGSVVHQNDHRSALMEYAKALASVGQLAKSLEQLDELDDVYRSSAMEDISANQVSMGDYGAAWQIARKIPDFSYLCSAAVRIGLAFDDREFIQKIEEIARNIEDAFDKRTCLRTIGIQTSRPDLLAEARQLTAESGGYAIFFAAGEELDAGLFEEAYRTALTEEAVDRRSEILHRVAIAAVDAGQAEFAERILPELTSSDEASVRGALWSIDGREVHIDRLWKIANEIEDDYLSGQSAVHSFIIRIDNVVRLERAAEIAAKIPHVDLREGALSSISTEYAKAGNFSMALEYVKPITEPDHLVSSLLEIAAEMN